MSLSARIAAHLRRRPFLGRMALRCLPDVPIGVNVAPIGRMRVRLRSHRGYWLRDPLANERLMLGALRRLIRPDDTVYDVGANIGLYVRFMLGEFGAGRVVAFEPMRANLGLLKINTAPVRDRVTILSCALADREGVEAFQVDDMSSASATLDRVTGGAACQGRRQYGLGPRVERVRATRLDHLIPSEGLPPPDVIKMDIEGAEALALAGAAGTLSTWRPRLALELHGPDTGRAVMRFLDGLGYALFSWAPAEGQRVYRRVHADDIPLGASYYYLHQVLASCDPSDLETPIAPYRPDSRARLITMC